MSAVAARIQARVEQQIEAYDFDSRPPRIPSRAHIRAGLVIPPVAQRYVHDRGVGYVTLWLVWDHDDSRGQQIVYDVRGDRYGLASRPQGRRDGRVMGFYDDFMSAVAAL